MPLVCPFWSDYVKSIEICPSVDGGTAYFLESNWDGAAPYFLDEPRFTPSCGGIWSSSFDDSYQSAYSGTPTEVWARTSLPPGGYFEFAMVARFFGSIAAAGISWTMTKISGPGALTDQGILTSFDMAYLRFALPAIAVEGIYVDVIDFTPDGGTPIRLHLKRVIELS